MKNNSGATLIATVLTLLIFALFIAIAVSLITTGSNISLQEEQGIQAFSIAEGGLESAILQFKNGTACNALPSGSLGAGSFTITGTNYTTATNLSSGITNADTVIPVISIAGFASHGRIRIDSENIIYSGTSSVAANCAPFSAPCFTGAIRGTSAAGHINNSRVSQDECLIRSTGIISTNPFASIQRVVEKSLQNPEAMMVYAKLNGDGTPYFRQWDGGQWGPERTATAVPANIQYIILKFARTRNEAILGTLSSNGDIRVQVWNGSTWSATILLANVGTTDANYRGFDIEYETNGDRAIVVYNDGTADPDYIIWNGGWSGAGNINIPTTGSPNWIEMARNPLTNSNEIAMISLDSNSDVYGMIWTGTGWDNMLDAGFWDNAASTSTTKAVHVAYEQQIGRALFVWGSSTSNRMRYRIWDGATLSGTTNQTITEINGDTARWVRLAPDPYSNNIMLGIQDNDSTPDLITSLWNGAALDGTGTEHDNGLEDSSRNFDLVYETAAVNQGRLWLLWGNGSRLARRQWTGAAWGGTTTTGDDTSFVTLLAHPVSGAVLSGIYESTNSGVTNRDIWESHLTQGSAVWSPEVTIWGGRTVAAPVRERVTIASEKYIPVIKWREVTQ